MRSYEEYLVNGISNLRQEELFFDYTLMAEGESVPVHKVVMAVCSGYFKAMLCSDMQESKENRVEMKELTASGLKAVVEYAYTGSCDLSMENAEEIVSTASYLRMEKLLSFCTDFFEDMIREEGSDHYLEILRLDDLYSLNIQNTLAEQIEEVSDGFLSKITGDRLVEILGSEKLQSTSEFRLWNKVLSWIRSTPDVEQDMIFALFSQIRFPFMSRDELSKVAQTEEIKSTSQCKSLLSEAQQYVQNMIMQPLRQTERTQTRDGRDSFIVACGDRFYSMESHYLTMKHLIGVPLGVTKSLKFCSQQIVTFENFLYVCGTIISSGVESNCFYRFDPRFHAWLRLPSVPPGRKSFQLVSCAELIYAIGVKDDKQVECYSIEDNKWKSRAPMEVPTCCMACVDFDEAVYVCGGYSLTDQPRSDMNCYNPSNDTWETRASMITPRIGHSMAKVGEKLYVFGGKGLCTLEFYSPKLDQWTSCKRPLQFNPVGVFTSDHVYLLGKKHQDQDQSNIYNMYVFEPENGTASCYSGDAFCNVGGHEKDLKLSSGAVKCAFLRVRRVLQPWRDGFESETSEDDSSNTFREIDSSSDLSLDYFESTDESRDSYDLY